MNNTGGSFSLRKSAIIIYLPSFLFASAEGAIIPVIPAMSNGMGSTLAVAGIVASMLTLGILVGDIPSGWLVSRLGERISMTLAAVVALVGVGISLLARDPLTLGAGIFVLGLSNAQFALARHALLTTVVPLAFRARALSLLGGMFRAGAVIGPLLSAGLIGLSGNPHSALWLTAVGLAGTVITVYFLPDPAATSDAPKLVTEPDGRVLTSGEDEVEKETRGLFRTIRTHGSVLARIGSASTITGAMRSSRNVLLPLWAVSIGLHDAQTALIVGLATALDFALFYSSGIIMDRWGRIWAAVPTLVIMSASVSVLACTHDLKDATTWFIVCAMVFAVGNSIGSGMMLTLGSDLAPLSNPAPFLGAFRFMLDAGNAGAPLLVSGLTALAGISLAAGGMGILGFIGAGMMLRYIPRYLPRR